MAFGGSLITVAVATVETPDGATVEREIVHHPGAVSVVPLLEGPEPAVLLVRQYRAAVDRELLELPAGKLDTAGEAPETAARRELEEEVGMRAGAMRLLAGFYNSPGFCDEHHTVYLATGLEPCEASAQGAEESHMVVETVSLADVPSLIATGAVVDAKSIIGLLLACEVLRDAG